MVTGQEMAGGYETYVPAIAADQRLRVVPGHPGLEHHDEATLVERVRAGVNGDSLAIARLPTLSPGLCDAIARHAAPTVVAAMLENDGAQISPLTLDQLVERSRDVIAYRVPLLRRRELSRTQAARLYLWVSPPLREFIVKSFQLSVTDELERERLDGAAVEPGSAAADQPASLVECLRQGQNLSFEASFARLIGLRITAVRRILEDRAGDRLAVACRASGFSADQFQEAYRLIQSTMARVSPRAASLGVPRLASYYDRIDPAEARETLKRWRREISQSPEQFPSQPNGLPLSPALNS